MKPFKLLESAIIGLLIGVVISVYILFMTTSGRELGSILNVVSLTNFINTFPEQYQTSIIFNFLFYIFVYTIYIIIFNIVFRLHKKIGIIFFVVLLLLIIGIIFQQINSFKKPVVTQEVEIKQVDLSNLNSVKKYFGEEVFGDLNGDQIDDIAFLIKRNEGDERGDMYYLSASLKIDGGYQGLNLVYIGEKIQIEKLEIQDRVVIVFYKEKSDSQEVLQYRTKVNENLLVEVVEDIPSEEFAEDATSEI